AQLPVERDLDPETRLVRAAAPVLERLYERFSDLPVTVALADARAVIVDRRGDPKGLELMDAAFLVPGANVDERFMGTSSVSMVLSTMAPFVVVGHEHFLHNLKALTCMAAPVRDPVGGTVQGAVNLSVPMEMADPGMALALQRATDRIGERLLELSTARERALVDAFLHARRQGRHAAVDLRSGRLEDARGTAPELTRREHLALMEAATELISSGGAALSEVPLAGGRVAVLRRRRLHHGDAEGAAVEVSFHGANGGYGLAAGAGTGAEAPSPATAVAPDHRRVPLLRPSALSPALREAPGGDRAPAGPVPGEPGPDGGAAPDGARGPDSGAAPDGGAGPDGEPGGRSDAWPLLVGEPGVGRLAVAARRRLSLLNEAGTRVGTTLDVRRTAAELTEIAVPEFADVAVVDLFEDVLAGREPRPGPSGTGTVMRRVAVRAAEDAAVRAAEDAAVRAEGDAAVRAEGDRAEGEDVTVGYPAGTPQARCLDAGRPVADSVLTAALADPAAEGGHPVGLLGQGAHTYLGAPLRAGNAVLGLVGFYRRGRDRPYEEDDLTLAGELAARTAMSVDNARRFARERDASLTLQRSLLPREMPRLTAADLAFRYLPADPGTGVGGDWCDAIPLSGLRVALVVGDVAGHGLQAAATMGRLRTAVRTLADLDLPPEEVLAHLDDLVGRSPGDPAMAATCLYAVYDPVSCRCTAAVAGHPPPVVVPPRGGPRLLDLPTGPPLGFGRLQPYESVTVGLPAGSLLALYTDGLLKEGRAYGATDARTGRLLEVLRDAPPSLEASCDRVTEALLPGGSRDDVALLLARVRALPEDRVASWELPADPSVVAEARAVTRRRLDAWGLADLEYGTGLVVSELVTNAVRYGGGGPVCLRLLRDDDALICEVSDRSNSSPRIRRAAVTEEGGRGLFLVARFTRNWGARFMPQGKTVWAEQARHPEAQEPEADERMLLAAFDDPG
ncbi:SpoIIE family protein phosphatase, partial [Streptomyces sp. URMC 125]|uniref:SpoIIE family protein phosphatase n=1 Tax=Streptomyces sp. URMC 125 TaxID=3423419 RepID=UPI003F1BB0C7